MVIVLTTSYNGKKYFSCSLKVDADNVNLLEYPNHSFSISMTMKVQFGFTLFLDAFYCPFYI